MELIRLRFKFDTFLSSYVDASTIFGAIAWGIRLLEGEDKLNEFLELYKKNKPPFLISSPLPEDECGNLWFPRPQLGGSVLDCSQEGKEPPTETTCGEENSDKYSCPKKNKEDPNKGQQNQQKDPCRGYLRKIYPIHKQFKKIRYLPWEIFKKILVGEIKTEKDLLKGLAGYLLKREIKTDEELLEEKNLQKLLECYVKKSPKLVETDATVKTAIHRLTATAAEGQLFNETIRISPKFNILVAVYNKKWWEKAKKALRVVKLGGNKTVGYGRFTFEEVPDNLLREIKPFVENTTHTAITLSPTFYEENIDIEESFYEPYVKRPAVDKTYGYFDANFIRLPVWKNILLYLKEGAYLKLKQPKPFIGCLKPALEYPPENKSSEGEKIVIYQYGYGFPLFVRENS
ncbi:MAG: hypothetical protein GXN97_03990 [Aquificae bacterium]|nr:hypothetical protein [Aquificota bacterium]